MRDNPNIKVSISFILVNYNLAEEIENCLDSLLKYLEEIDFEVIIVDNNSSDKKLFDIEKRFLRNNFHFYYLDENLGFGKGCNYGFSKASGKYVCFLNPDTIFTMPIVSPIIRLLENETTIGIIGPRQMLRKKIFDFSAGYYPNVITDIFNVMWSGTFLEAFLIYLITKFSSQKFLQIDWVLGAALFIKSEVFSKVNGFDKDYFMFFEEVDLCRRVSRSGYTIIYIPSLEIKHIGSVTGKRDYKAFTIRTYTSKFLYISKHCRHINKFLMNFLLSLQLFTQLVLWVLLYPIAKKKSKQKIDAFLYLIKKRIKVV